MILSLLALAESALPPAPPVPPSPPPIVRVGDDDVSFILSFSAGRARCRSGEEPLLADEPPLPVVIAWATGRPLPSPLSFSFRIDPSGRPLSIAEAPRQRGPNVYFDRQDVIAALSASRFAKGAERSGCTISYEAKAEPIDTADLATLYRFVALQPRPPFDAGRRIFERTTPPGSTCFDDPRLNVRLRAYPAFEGIPQAPGTLSYSLVGFDLGPDGRPRQIRRLGSSGNSALDRQSLDAVRRSRFSPIAKRGCTYSYWRRQTEALQPPEMPPAQAYADGRSSCPNETPWAYMPPLSFPREFERRSIEGWAIVRFDVAPWGAVGNVSALAAEPAAPFGQQAVQIVGGARKPPSAQGASGCIARVRFRIGATPETSPILDP